MSALTRKQRIALKRLFDRGSSHNPDGITYRQYRRTVQTELYGSAIMVMWCGMWLGIEPDGYTHS